MGKTLETIVFYSGLSLMTICFTGLIYNAAHNKIKSKETAGYLTSMAGTTYVLYNIAKRDIEKYIKKLDKKNEKHN